MRGAALLVSAALLVTGTLTEEHSSVLVRRGNIVSEVIKLQPDARFPGQCYDPTSQQAFFVGRPWFKPSRCQQFTCAQLRSEFELTISVCAILTTEPHCKLVENKYNLFPRCCPKEVCNNSSVTRD